MKSGQRQPIQEERLVASARLLISRLERLSADSYWAHQASGLRGSLLRCLQKFDERSGTNVSNSYIRSEDWQHLGELVERGFVILALAARSMRRPTSRSLKH